MWSATTDAYTKGDFDWIHNVHNKINLLLIGVIILLCIMVVASPFVYSIWIGDKVTIPMSMSILMAIYSFILMWSQSYSYILNGMGKLKLQAINTIFVAVLFYPIIHTLGSIYQVIGILIGMCIVNIPGIILNAIQIKLILLKKATGIWNK